MSRPRKNNAEYFSHDCDMRNDKKILAVRSKYGFEGYSVYCMLLETLCGTDFFKIKMNNTNLLLISGDFRMDIEKLRSIINFFISIDLIQQSDSNYIICRGLNNRLKYLLDKRLETRSKYIKVKKSKVKKSKGKEIRRNPSSCSRNSQKPIVPVVETSISNTETPHQTIINCYLETQNQVPFGSLPKETINSGYRRFGRAAKALLKDTNGNTEFICKAIRYLPTWASVTGLSWSLETVSKALAEPKSFAVQIPKLSENERKLIKVYLFLKGWQEDKVKELDLQKSKHTINLIPVAKEILSGFNNDLNKALKALEKYKGTLKEDQELNIHFASKWIFENYGGRK